MYNCGCLSKNISSHIIMLAYKMKFMILPKSNALYSCILYNLVYVTRENFAKPVQSYA